MNQSKLPYIVLALLAILTYLACSFHPYEFYPLQVDPQVAVGYRLNRFTGTLFLVKGDEEREVTSVKDFRDERAAGPPGLLGGHSPQGELLGLFMKLLATSKKGPETLPSR